MSVFCRKRKNYKNYKISLIIAGFCDRFRSSMAKKVPKITTSRGYSYARFNGKQYFLGKAGSDNAAAKYNELFADSKNVQKVKRVKDTGRFAFAQAYVKPLKKVKDLIAAFLKDRAKRPDDAHVYTYKTATEEMLAVFGDKAVNSIRYADMEKLVRHFADTPKPNGDTRSLAHVNGLLTGAKSIFRWGRKTRYVSSETLDEVLLRGAVKHGETKAVLTEPRQDAPMQDIENVIKYATPMIADMLRVFVLTGARPGELERITFEQIKQDEQEPTLWIYTPKKHKNKGKGKHRELPLFSPAMDILEKYRDFRKPGDLIFNSIENHKYILEQKRLNRKTKVSPSQAARNEYRKENPRVNMITEFTSQNINDSIERAIDAAKADGVHIDRFTIYQLRHTATTFYSQPANGGGRDLARIIDGHNDRSTTERYDHSRRDILRSYARWLLDKNKETPVKAEVKTALEEKVDKLTAMLEVKTTLEKKVDDLTALVKLLTQRQETQQFAAK